MLEEVAEGLLSRLTEVSIDSGDAKATITIVDYSELALDTVTVTIGGTAHVLTEGTDWARGASNIAAAASLAAAIDALDEVGASSSGAVVTITAPQNITSLAVSDAVNMTLVDSSLITIYDPIKNWEVDKWKDAVIEVEVDGIHYYRTATSNTATTLTIGTLPVGHPVTAGAHYNIRLSTRLVTVASGEIHVTSGHITVDSGEIHVVSGHIHVVSGQVIAKISGEAVHVSSGHITIDSGEIHVVSGHIHVVSGQVIAKISGEAVHVSSGHIHVSSGQLIAKISGETVIAKISGEAVHVSSGHIHVVSGQLIAKISGEAVHVSSGHIHVVSGQVIAKISGETVIAKTSGQMAWVGSGHITIDSGQVIAKISGQAVHVSSGHIHVVSGQLIAKISGETVIAKISGQAVHVSSGHIHVVSGQLIAKISGEAVHVSSGHIHVVSGQLIAKISGEIVDIKPPTAVKTGLIRSIISASGGEVLHSGAVKAAQVKSLSTNSGLILIGSSGDRPWYEDTCSGLGFVLDPGEVKSEDIDNFDKIYLVAQVSGDQISFLGVN